MRVAFIAILLFPLLVGEIYAQSPMSNTIGIYADQPFNDWSRIGIGISYAYSKNRSANITVWSGQRAFSIREKRIISRRKESSSYFYRIHSLDFKRNGKALYSFGLGVEGVPSIWTHSGDAESVIGLRANMESGILFSPARLYIGLGMQVIFNLI